MAPRMFTVETTGSVMIEDFRIYNEMELLMAPTYKITIDGGVYTTNGHEIDSVHMPYVGSSFTNKNSRKSGVFDQKW